MSETTRPRDPEPSPATVLAAQGGDAAALEQLVVGVRDRVYRLSLRMTAQPLDAEDAAQEILIRVITRLSTFRGDAAFSTWVHRIAVNHLLDRSRNAVEQMELSFDDFAADLLDGFLEVAKESGHCPGASHTGLVHQFTAPAHQAKGVREGQAASRVIRGELAERMPGCRPNLCTESVAGDCPNRRAVRQEGGLRVMGERQLIRRPIETQG